MSKITNRSVNNFIYVLIFLLVVALVYSLVNNREKENFEENETCTLDSCGGKSLSGKCWCDKICESSNDCCSNKKEVCDSIDHITYSGYKELGNLEDKFDKLNLKVEDLYEKVNGLEDQISTQYNEYTSNPKINSNSYDLNNISYDLNYNYPNINSNSYDLYTGGTVNELEKIGISKIPENKKTSNAKNSTARMKYTIS